MHNRSLGKVAAACLLLSTLAANAAVPEIEPGQVFTLSENLPAGTVLGTVEVSDADEDAVHVFVLGEESDNWNIKPVPFAIDPATKTLRTTASLNFEHQPVWKLLVGATDGSTGDTPGDTEIIEVSLQDVFDEAIVGPGGESGTFYGVKPDYVGSEAILNFAPASFGSLPEGRELELYLQLPAGVTYLGTDQEEGWNCGYVPHAVVCTRDGMDTPETAGFKLHLLLPDTPGGIHYVYAIAAGDYVHFDGETGGLLPMQEVWPHPAPGDLHLVLSPKTQTAEVGKSFRYTINLTEKSDPALGALGTVSVSIKLDPRWGAIDFKGTDSSWACMQDGDFAKCERSSVPRGTKTPLIAVNVTAPQARGSYFFTAWVSGPPDSDTSNNFATHHTLVQGRPVFDDQGFSVPASSHAGASIGPMTATDDGWPVPATLTFSADGVQPPQFSIQPNGSIIQVGVLEPEKQYLLSARVTDGGGLSDTAKITINATAGTPGCANTGDNDGDGICDDDDADDDNDGQPDGEDPCPFDAQNQCCGPQGDQSCSPAGDDDGDGIPNAEDNCPGTPNPLQTDTDDDGIGDACDPDDDGDGAPDEDDPCPLDPADACACTVENPDTDGDGLCDSADTDDDGDGQPDNDDPCPLDPQNKCACDAGNPDTDGDGTCDSEDGDDDGDTLPDGTDPCPLDPQNECACDAENPDTDGDGICNSIDTDDDGDGTPDGDDPCPLDASNACCGANGGEPCDTTGEEDDDGDTVPNDEDNCDAVPNPQQTDTDGDGLGDACDPDDDGDGTPDGSDPCPLDATNACCGANGDQPCGTSGDEDDDGDTVPNDEDNCDAVPNPQQTDTDGDGLGDACDPDDDGDGTPDGTDPCPLDAQNQCGCSAADPDTDGDGHCDSSDPDDDGDGEPDTQDQCPLDPSNACEGRIFRDGFEEP